MKKDLPTEFTPLLTEPQAARYLTRSASSMRRDRKHGTGPIFVRIGRSIRYPKTELDEFLAACRSTRDEGVDGE
jgi:predicted DNA-binding transcriptional regulator AlpA